MEVAILSLPRPLGMALRMTRRLRGMKQAHVAELLGVTQSTVSRIESGDIQALGPIRARLLDLVSARLDPNGDAALRRLVDGAASPLHLICDLSHRLLAASAAREQEWRQSVSELRGRSLWPFASEAVVAAEAGLEGMGWGARDGALSVQFETGPNASPELRIMPGVLVWERIILADGSPARLVTRLA